MSPKGRAEARELRLRLLRKVERLIGLGLLHRGRRNQIATYKFMAKPVVRRARRRKPSVGETTSTKAVSGVKSPPPPKQDCRPLPVSAEVVVASHGGQQPPPTEAKTESVPDRSQVTQAARALACLPRKQPRKLTGWLHGQQCWHGRLVSFPDGVIGKLVWANRGRVLVYCESVEEGVNVDVNDFCEWQKNYDERLLHFAARERDVQLFKRPEAALLGSLKRGVRERRSELKAATARANGLMPPRAGRSRGRPRKSTLPSRGAGGVARAVSSVFDVLKLHPTLEPGL